MLQYLLKSGWEIDHFPPKVAALHYLQQGLFRVEKDTFTWLEGGGKDR